MAAHEHDSESDAIRWGMSLLEVDPPFYSGYYRGGGDVIQNDSASRTLQEDFSQLALRDSSWYSHEQEAEENYSIDWPTTSTSYDSFDHDRSNGDSDDTVSPSLCSSSSYGDRRGIGSYSSELTDGYRLGDEVGKRLDQFIPIRVFRLWLTILVNWVIYWYGMGEPHVPKINGDIPTFDEVTSDHERLLNRLQAFGFVEVKVEGDGNCQFRALSDQLYGTTDCHKTVRKEIVKQLKSNADMYEGYVPMKYREYLSNVSRFGEWGDHVTLQAAADSYAVKILVITSFKDTCYIEILPRKKKPKRVIFLSFWAEVHYNAICFRGRDTACNDPDKKKEKKKKRRWIFGKKH
ncbi:OVARIAN TUMOR DOMAIN-containing deubiquitinating enzyme 10 [Linum perenne]